MFLFLFYENFADFRAKEKTKRFYKYVCQKQIAQGDTKVISFAEKKDFKLSLFLSVIMQNEFLNVENYEKISFSGFGCF